MDDWGGVLAALLPSIGVGVIFWFAMRAIVNADRSERQAVARMESEAATPGADRADDSPEISRNV